MKDLTMSLICCNVAEASVEPADIIKPKSTSGTVGSRITKNKTKVNSSVRLSQIKQLDGKWESLNSSQMAHPSGAYPGFYNMK